MSDASDAQDAEREAERLRQARTEDARIALRPDRAGRLYDVVVNDVSMVRIKRLNDQWWIACYLTDETGHVENEERITFNLVDGRLSVGEEPEEGPGITYEVRP